MKSKEIKALRQKLKKKVSTDTLEKSIAELQSIISSNSPNWDLLVSLLSAYNRLEDEILKGVITYEQKEASYNKMVNTLLAIINSISLSDLYPQREQRDTEIINKRISDKENSEKHILMVRSSSKAMPEIVENPIEKFEVDVDSYTRLIIVDLDDFSAINQRYGEEIGNEIQSTIVRIIHRVLPDDAILAFTGKDEYLVFYNGQGNETTVPHRIHEGIKHYYWKELHQALFVTGTVSYSQRGIKEINITIDGSYAREYKRGKESIGHWIMRTAWGVKNGKMRSKGSLLKAPRALPEYVHVSKKDYSNYERSVHRSLRFLSSDDR